MSQKLTQYLNEAHASEQALVRVLQAQIAMTPRGTYRTALERHLRETQDHAQRVARRLQELGAGANPVQVVFGAVETAVGQAVALGKTPLDLLRGTSGEEKILKNAKDTCATEALEIGTYTSIERLARALGDTETAQLAQSILRDEERMLQQVLREIPKLTDAVARGAGYDITTTGAADTVRKAARKTRRTARQATGREAPIARYDSLTAEEINARLSDLSQADLAKVEAYERGHDNRATVLSRIESLRGSEPWRGYDELTAAEIESVLSEGDEDRAKQVRAYERAHKARATVLRATEREHTSA
jgi:ferritin-like metal-binding protein YciE